MIENPWADIVENWTFVPRADYKLACTRWSETVTGPHSAELFEKYTGVKLSAHGSLLGSYTLIPKATKAKLDLLLGANYYAIIKMIEARGMK